MPKDGSGFDLPVALATLAACGHMPVECVRDVGAVGEVSLEGVVRLTRGMLSVAESAGEVGVRLLITPVEGLPAAVEVSAVPVAGVRSLAEAVGVARDPCCRARVLERGRRWLKTRAVRPDGAPDTRSGEVAGHHHASGLRDRGGGWASPADGRLARCRKNHAARRFSWYPPAPHQRRGGGCD